MKPIEMRDGETFLIMIQDGQVLSYTWDMSLPHSEFVRRATGTRPVGAWVGTVSKIDGEVVAISSKHFYDVQLPASEDVLAAVRRQFR